MPRTRVQEVAGYGGVFLGTSAGVSYLRADGVAAYVGRRGDAGDGEGAVAEEGMRVQVGVNHRRE